MIATRGSSDRSVANTSINDPVVYHIDGQDNLVFVNEHWDRFAMSNAGAHLAARRVIGQSLWSFVCDDTTIGLYRVVVERARAGQRSRFEFRCDAPDCVRLLEMIVTPHGAERVQFETRTLIEERRQALAFPQPPPMVDNTVIMCCSWCKRIEVDRTWLVIERAIAQLRLFEKTKVPILSHGICPNCRGNLEEMLALR